MDYLSRSYASLDLMLSFHQGCLQLFCNLKQICGLYPGFKLYVGPLRFICYALGSFERF